MKKGSLYYHFSGKEELMKAVLEAGRRQFQDQVLEIAYEEDRPPHERMELLFERVEADYLTIEGGCIMGNIGLETVHTVPAFRPVIRGFFRTGSQRLSRSSKRVSMRRKPCAGPSRAWRRSKARS